MYQLGDVAKAAGEKPGTVQLWLSRGYLVLSEKDRDAAGTGRVRLFSFETAMQVAVGAELARQGLPVRRAMEAAMSFAHWGDESRQPGRPYAEDETFLIVHRDQQTVIQIEADGNFLKKLPKPFHTAFTAVDAGTVYHRAVSLLGGDPLGDWREQSLGDQKLAE